MAEDNKNPKSDINFEFGQSFKGLNMDNIPSQIDKGSLSYALNAAIENFDANSITYQNEPANEFCLEFPHNYILIGKYLIPEQVKQIFFLSNPSTGDSEIGYMYNNDCVYRTLINAKCLNFDIRYPIHKVVHKTSNCGTEIYWAQPNADRRYINLDPTKIPMLPLPGSTPCDEHLSEQLDCNQIRVQPNYDIPQLFVSDVIIGGNVLAGVYQFGIQYSDALSNPLSSVHSITNPTPIADIQITSPNFNYPVGKSILVDVSNIDLEGQFDYFNLIVIKTINAITSVELVGTYNIDSDHKVITYAGQNQTAIRLTINDVFEKFPFYGPADDVTTSQNVLIWKGLSTPERISYQQIANQITLLWETYRIPADENYSDEINATHLRGYLRDEVYPFEFVPLLLSGKQADGFHIPGRALTQTEAALPMIDPSDPDFIEDPDSGPQPYWKIYNTAIVIGESPERVNDINYKGPFNYGAFAYWESDQSYPCDEEMWGELANQKIRHHKFPDVAVSPIIESAPYVLGGTPVMGNDAVFPIGVRVDIQQIRLLIAQSNLTPEQKADIVGFKIVRGDRTDNKSIVAKGILRNVGKYEREDQTFYYPNYPYNDLNADPFINSQNNAFSAECQSFTINITSLNVAATSTMAAHTRINFIDCNTNKDSFQTYFSTGVKDNLCSLTKPILQGAPGAAIIGYTSYDVWTFQSGGTTAQNCLHFHVSYEDYIKGPSEAEVKAHNVSGSNIVTVRVVPGTVPQCSQHCGVCGKEIFHRPDQDVRNYSCTGSSSPLPISPDDTHRQIFNSPETSFGQPFLGDVLKLESVMFGAGQAHFVEVKDNAKYKLLTKEAQQDALKSAGNVSGGDATSAFTAYQAYLQIYINGITKKNYAYSFNSIADYNYSVPVPNGQHIKQRRLDLKKYLIPAIQNVGEADIDINNYQRESSVYLRTDLDLPSLPFPHLSPNVIPLSIRDISRFTVGCGGGSPCAPEGTTTSTTTAVPYTGYCPGSCSKPEEKHPISVVSYYASLKNTFRGQWGQIYSYQTIDTGFQIDFSQEDAANPNDLLPPRVVFGGDTFISRFAFKTKLPFFIDNRVGAPDDSEIFYDELGNIAYPKYWHSARSILESFDVPSIGVMANIISYKAHNFDCPNCQTPAPPAPNPDRTFYDGVFYLFAYGIPNFYVETSYNTDLRQAYNSKEGDFWPHVSNSIPDEWVQETNVSIANDNTYFYNGSFSKQNTENLFSHIPANFKLGEPCNNIYPFRAIFSDPQVATADVTVNNWLTYRAVAYFDFPQNYGKLTSLDGVERGQVLARFENKTLYYNALYTTQTNTNGQVYLGQSLFSRNTPPIDQAETDLGYLGSQHKFILKIPQGQITIDAIRGQIFLLTPQSAKDLSEPGSGMNRFFTDHLAFEILKYYPNAQIDNHFNGLGLHGVYDSKYERVIITKLDYIPLNPEEIEYDEDTQEFYKITKTEETSFRTRVFLSDKENFCSKSWTLSYSLITNSWLSFHSYIPNWYIGENNFFYSGKKDCCSPVKFIAGELVDNPITTTTSTTFPQPPSTTTTTTIALNCTIIGGAQATDCILLGTGIITVPPVPPPCTRPPSVIALDMYTGYTIISPPSVVVSTLTAIDSCNAKQYVFSNPDTSIPTSITGYGFFLGLGEFIYANNGTNDCTPVADGFYYTYDLEDQFTYQTVGGVVVAVTPCNVTTTTTTTTCSMYLYNVEFYACGTCALIGTGIIGNNEVLTLDKFYYDTITTSRMKVISSAGCSAGIDRTITDSSKQDSCPAVVCTPPPTTTTTTT